MLKLALMILSLSFMLLLTGCGGSTYTGQDGSEGRAYYQSKVESHNQQVINSGKGTIVNPGFY